jgi:hypothetical protein
MAKVVSLRPFTAVTRLWSRANSCESWADRMALGQNFRQVLSISPVRIIPPVLQSYLHLHVALNKKDKRAKPDNLPEKKETLLCRMSAINVFKTFKRPARAGFVVDKMVPRQVFL